MAKRFKHLGKSNDVVSKEEVRKIIKAEILKSRKNIDDTYLDLAEADGRYLGSSEGILKPINENLNMMNFNIINVANPINEKDATHKNYVDTLLLRNNKIIFKTIQYYEIMSMKPAIWISTFDVKHLLYAKPKKTKPFCLVKSSFETEGTPTFKETPEGTSYYFTPPNSKIKSNVDFKQDFTFFVLARKQNETDNGIVFRNAENTCGFGFLPKQNAIKIIGGNKFQSAYNPKGEGELTAKLTLFILWADKTRIHFYSCDEKLFGMNSSTFFADGKKDWGKLIMGSIPPDVGLIYEVICFDRCLTEKEFDKVRKVMKSNYPIRTSKKPEESQGVTEEFLSQLL
jgi:hypothetical protein